MENKYYVYRLCIEGDIDPMYIGKGSGNRAWDHFKPSSLKYPYHKNRVIKKAQAAGKNILVEMLEENLSEDDAYYYEVLYIAYYGRQNDGGCLTNHNTGGKGNARECSEATKRKIGATGKGHTLSEEHKKKLSLIHKGKKLSTEHIEKGRKAKLGSLNPVSKLNEYDIAHIIILYYEDFTCREIGEVFGISAASITDVIKQKTWRQESVKYIPGPLPRRKKSEAVRERARQARAVQERNKHIKMREDIL